VLARVAGVGATLVTALGAALAEAAVVVLAVVVLVLGSVVLASVVLAVVVLASVVLASVVLASVVPASVVLAVVVLASVVPASVVLASVVLATSGVEPPASCANAAHGRTRQTITADPSEARRMALRSSSPRAAWIPRPYPPPSRLAVTEHGPAPHISWRPGRLEGRGRYLDGAAVASSGPNRATASPDATTFIAARRFGRHPAPSPIHDAPCATAIRHRSSGGAMATHRKKPMNARRDAEPRRDAEEAFDARPVEGPEADRELALAGKALGHNARVHILRLLRRNETGATVAELVAALGLAQSTVSEHLRVLREASLVVSDPLSRKGAQRVDVHRLRRLKALVGSL
jgi:DNA-binding transcriptional ArsR family regulator